MSENSAKNVWNEALSTLRTGGVIGLPTETVYGLAADALRPEAVAKIFQIKNRPHFDPLIVHLADISLVKKYVTDFPALAQKLAAHFWPGPLTLVLPKRALVPDLVTSGLPHVAIRVPAHPLALKLLREFAGPLAAPSANRFGRISPTTVQAVRRELGSAVSIVLDGGTCRIGLESTILSFAAETPQLLRAGGIPIEAIEKIIGVVTTAHPTFRPLAPGQLPQHYAPHTPLRLVENLEKVSDAEKSTSGFLGWGKCDASGFATVRNLSPTASFAEAATHFFRHLRELDESGVRQILAVPLPERDLGRAINDRLRRAAHRET